MNENKIFIAIPSRNYTDNNVNSRLVEVIREILITSSDDIEFFIERGTPVDMVRNRIVNQFLKSDSNYMLMIDDDIVPPPDILKMTLHDKDIVAALCYGFTPSRGIYPVVFTLDPEPGKSFKLFPPGAAIENHGLIKADLIGTGCFMIRRNVFEILEPPYFMFEFTEKHDLAVVSEGGYFCRKARNAGLEIYLDSDKICSHYKTLDLKVMMEWVEKYTKRKMFTGFI